MADRQPRGPRAGDRPGDRPRAGSARSSARRRAREFALQGLYEWLVGGQDGAAIEGHLMQQDGFDAADSGHFGELLHGAIDGADALRAEFAPFIDRAPAALSPVEHAILLLGCYELKHRAEIPYRVVINEAVELAKSFGGTDGFKYINGVLDKVAGKLRPTEAAR